MFGRIVERDTGAGIANVSVTRTGGAPGSGTATVLTNADGYYTFTGIAGGTYSVTPKLAGYYFMPETLGVGIGGADGTASDIIGAALPAKYR
jgi:hypothetical protein